MKLLKCLFLALAAPLLLIGGAEGILRLAGADPSASFFVPADINGREVWTDNPFFGFRFFPPRIARTPPGIVFDRVKRPNTIRIFVLGESAAMGEPMEEFGLARQLACLLSTRHPGQRFEVVNAAMTAINSHVITDIAREASRLQPDVFVLYIGNNEVVGPFGPGTVFGPFSASPCLTRVRVHLTRLRLARWLRRALESGLDPMAESVAWEGLDMFSRNPVEAADPRLAGVRRLFRANLRSLLDNARSAGAETILCTVAVNLRDNPPFSGAEARRRFHQARDLEAAGRTADALAAYENARDLDTLRVRADSFLNAMIRETGQSGADGLRFVDAERRFKERSPGGVPGDDWFIDHVHFNFAGSYWLARDIATAVEDLPVLRGEIPAGEWLSLDECRQHLLYTVWSELDLTDQSIRRLRRPPFRNQPDTPSRLMALFRHRADLLSSIREVDPDELRPHYMNAMRTHPDDWFYPSGWASLLLNAGYPEDAERHLRTARALAPHLLDLRGAHALALGFLGRPDDGIRALLDGGRNSGGFPARFMASIGRTLLDAGRTADAAVFLEEAVRLDPGNPSAARSLAEACTQQGDIARAEAVLRRALETRPDHAESAEDLALLLAGNDRWVEAMDLFDRILERHPNRPETRVKRAMCQFRHGASGQAIRELEDLRAEAPAFAPARFNLGQVYAARQQWEQAAAELETAVRLQPDFAEAWFQLYRVRLARNEPEAARRALRTALQLAPGRPEFLREWSRIHAPRRPPPAGSVPGHNPTGGGGPRLPLGD